MSEKIVLRTNNVWTPEQCYFSNAVFEPGNAIFAVLDARGKVLGYSSPKEALNRGFKIDMEISKFVFDFEDFEQLERIAGKQLFFENEQNTPPND